MPLNFQGTESVPCSFSSIASNGINDSGLALLKENLLKFTVASHVLPGTPPKLSWEDPEQALDGRFKFVGTILPPGVPVKDGCY